MLLTIFFTQRYNQVFKTYLYSFLSFWDFVGQGKHCTLVCTFIPSSSPSINPIPPMPSFAFCIVIILVLQKSLFAAKTQKIRSGNIRRNCLIVLLSIRITCSGTHRISFIRITYHHCAGRIDNPCQHGSNPYNRSVFYVTLIRGSLVSIAAIYIPWITDNWTVVLWSMHTLEHQLVCFHARGFCRYSCYVSK